MIYHEKISLECLKYTVFLQEHRQINYIQKMYSCFFVPQLEPRLSYALEMNVKEATLEAWLEEEEEESDRLRLVLPACHRTVSFS
jgi:hypothetical protein